MRTQIIDFKKSGGLVPVIIQDAGTNRVLMLGYMNTAAFEQTQATGLVHFWSRSRSRLWMKGEESGNTLRVRDIAVDCDRDTLLVRVELEGTAVCHTGSLSCFDPNTQGALR